MTTELRTASLAPSYHQLGRLAQVRGDYDEAVRQYRRALDISERLGDQAGLARCHHNLGVIAQHRRDHDEAARQYHRSLDINELLGNQGDMATTYHQLGILAQVSGDYDEAARQYHRSLDISERLGDHVGMAVTYSQLGNLESDRGGSAAAAVAWHVKALSIRVHLGVPQARNNLNRLSALRHELGAGPFAGLLAGAVGDTELVEAVTSWLDQWDDADDSAD